MVPSNVPTNAPDFGLKALIHPLPKFPTRRIAGERPETRWRDLQAQWQVQHSPGDQPPIYTKTRVQCAVEIEYVDESVAGPGDVVVLVGVLLREGDIKVTSYDLVIERRVPLRR